MSAARSPRPARRPEPQRETPAPTGLPARAAAASVLDGVLVRRQPLDALFDLGGGDPLYRKLGDRDRALARAIATTALRRHGQVADALDRMLERPLPSRSGRTRRILEIAATQILFMAAPPHAVVSVAVDMAEADRHAKHFKGLVNAILRRLVTERDAILAAQDAPRLNTPDWLWTRWVAYYGEAQTRAIAAAHMVEPALDLTLNPSPPPERGRSGAAGVGVSDTARSDDVPPPALRATSPFQGEESLVLPNGTLRLTPGGAIESLPGFAEGAWWVQDAAAALPAQLLGDVRGFTVLDLCAAPGGKTAQLCAAGARVTAVDQSASRMDRLRINLKRLGFEAETIVADATAWDPGRTFDAILLDAPCSATGTIRRHPDIPHLKTPADIETLAALQRRLLAQAASLLRPGGTLVFSTCSLEPEEGEAQTATALAGLPLDPYPIPASETAGLGHPAGEGGAIRTLPSDLPHENPVFGGLAGFYIARYRRR
ncbi:MAG: methyltransferase domain-containing protein [Bauldia sp.]|nr:methyltransferase domain-containing protein [Bauldia sp.]